VIQNCKWYTVLFAEVSEQGFVVCVVSRHSGLQAKWFSARLMYLGG
jgi:hypothetical protein